MSGIRSRSFYRRAVHLTLSQNLTEILEENPGDLTINELLVRTQNRGVYLLLIFLSLPFIIPVALPGVSTMLGLSIAWIALRRALGQEAPLPAFIGARPLPPKLRSLLSGKGVGFLKWVEKWVKSRSGSWLSWEPIRRLHDVVLVLMGLLLALPFPPLPPLTNSLPAYCIILIAASLIERDGVMIWLGYVLVVLTFGYLGGVTWLLVEAAWKFLSHRLFSGSSSPGGAP